MIEIFLGNILLFLTMRGDDALIGKILGTTALGYYSVAYALANTPTPTIGYLVSKVALPTYAKLQDDISALTRSYLFVLKLTATLAFPALGGLYILAPSAVRLIYGEPWLPMVSSLRILCLYGGLRCIIGTTGPLFLGTGKPQQLTKTAGLLFIATGLLIYYPTRTWGIEGASMAITVALAATGCLAFVYVSRILGTSVWRILRQLGPAALGVSAMIGALMGLGNLVNFESVNILIPTLTGASVYVLLVALLDQDLYQEFKRLIRAARSSD